MLTRRDLIKLGLISGGYFILGADGTITRADDDLPASPFTKPFVDKLLIPDAAIEVEPFFDLPSEYIQYWVDVNTTRFFKIVAEARTVQILNNGETDPAKQLPPTKIWGYRDLSPGALKTRVAGTVADVVDYHILGPTIVQLFGELGPARNVAGYHASGTPLGPVGGGFVVRHVNCLPANDNGGFGVPRTTIHLHGGHHLARADGFPENLENPPTYVPDGFPSRLVMEPPEVIPGSGPPCCSTPLPNYVPCATDEQATESQVLDYYYPILDVGELDLMRGQSKEPAERSERPSTQWYHDHLLDFTGPNAYKGQAGFVLCFDEIDSNDEEDPDPRARRLPSGRFDICLALQDKRFNQKGELVFSSFDHDGFLGDKFLVNGKIQPYLEVERRKYRFRVLNGSNARIYQLFLTDEQNTSYRYLDMIAVEGGLLSRPLRNLESFMVAMAERVEVVIDFARFPLNTNVYLENRLAQSEGRRPDGLRSQGDRLLQFRVVRDPDPAKGDPSRVPDVLRPFSAIPQAHVDDAYNRLRTFEFERSHGAWVINGKLAGDLDRPITSPKRGEPVIWRLVNNSGGWWHPIHIHSEFFRVIKRNGRTPTDPLDPARPPLRAWVPGYERDGLVKKDTILLRDNDSVDVFLKFRDHLGPFVFHCHNMEHEDMAMMARFDVVPSAPL